MSQPVWKYIANLGDADPIEHDGAFLYVDSTGVYDPELELLVRQCGDEPTWQVYRVCLEPCTFIDGVLSDNAFHKDYPAWFAKDIGHVSSFVGIDESDLIKLLCSLDPGERAEGYQCLIGHYGAYEFDQYPRRLDESEVRARYTLGEIE